MRVVTKKTAAGTLLGTAVITAVAQAAEFSRDYTAPWLPMPPVIVVPVITSVASLGATTQVAMPETILEDADEHRGELEPAAQAVEPKRG